MRVKEHFDRLYDEKEGIDNLYAFAPDLDKWDVIKTKRWPHWLELFRLCLGVMREQYADWELADTFGPNEYLIFEKIMRGGFARFQKKHPNVPVPKVWNYAVGELARLRKGETAPQ